MPRRIHTTLAAAAAALAASLAVVGAAAGQTPERPNIVFVMTDDQTASSIAYQRNVRLLQSEGTTFANAFASFPLCCPSRATYLTGQYSHNHGVIHNAGPFGGYQRLDHSNTLPLWLQSAGYRTMHVGRHLNGYGVHNLDLTEVPPGWDDWIATLGATVFNYERWQTNENGQIHWRPGGDHPGEHQTDFLGRRAVEAIDAAAGSPQPFFLSLTFSAPHLGQPRGPDDPVGLLGTPYPAPRHRGVFGSLPLPRPPNFDPADVSGKPRMVADRPRLSPEMQDAIQRNYQRELESLLGVDEALGAVLAALRRHGALDDTLVIYTSDHGFFHGEHRLPGEKVLPYDAAARIPLIVRGPGIPRGLRLGHLVGNIDWAPTIVDAARARPGRLMDGRSLLEPISDPRRDRGREIVHENGVGANRVPMYRGLRNRRYLWIEHRRTGERELYDLREDPYELRNLADLESHAEIRGLLAARLRKLQRCRGARECDASRPALRLAARRHAPRARGRGRARLRATRSCIAGDLRLAVHGSDLGHVERVVYLRGKRRLRGTRRPPFAVRIRPAALPGGRRVTLRALVTTVDGRRATYDRRVRACRRAPRSSP